LSEPEPSEPEPEPSEPEPHRVTAQAPTKRCGSGSTTLFSSIESAIKSSVKIPPSKAELGTNHHQMLWYSMKFLWLSLVLIPVSHHISKPVFWQWLLLEINPHCTKIVIFIPEVLLLRQ
jgi:hypothetical protein